MGITCFSPESINLLLNHTINQATPGEDFAVLVGGFGVTFIYTDKLLALKSASLSSLPVIWQYCSNCS